MDAVKDFLNKELFPNLQEAKEIQVISRIEGSNECTVLFSKPNDKPREYTFTFFSEQDADDFECQLDRNPGKGYQTITNFKDRIKVERVRDVEHTTKEDNEVDNLLKDYYKNHP